MTILAHISDLHFGRERPKVIEGLLMSLAEQQPERLLISGDLTQRAKQSEFVAAAVFLEKLHWPYLIVPGNHDLAAYNLQERFCYPWKKWRRLIATDLEPVLEAPGYAVAGINTARRWAAPLDWSRGRISVRQTHHALEALKGHPASRLRLLIAHHPFWLPAGHEHRGLIGGRRSALQALREGGIDMILGGHVHLAYTHVLKGIIISHAGTSGSDRLAPGYTNSYNLIRGDRRCLKIDMMAWNGKAFRCQETQTFTRDPSGWSQAPAKAEEHRKKGEQRQ